MSPSIWYYTLLLSETSSRLFEGFRDTLIEIEEGGFPSGAFLKVPHPVEPIRMEHQRKEFYVTLDRSFAHFYDQDPLKLVLVGANGSPSIFRSVSAHEEDILGSIEGSYDATSVHDLGRIVWPVVKEALAGARDNALHELHEAVRARKVASGLDDVWRSVEAGRGGRLLVEEDYHVRGSIARFHPSLVICEEVDVRDVLDDVVDVLIERVLEKEGTVVFLDGGSLTSHQRMVLLLRD